MIANVKAVLADIDATLVERGKSINPITTSAINILHEHGVLFGVASGRPVTDIMRRNARTWNLNFDFDVLIGMNGGQLWDKDHEETEQVYTLAPETLHDIMVLMNPLHKNAFAYEDDHLIANELSDLVLDSARRNELPAIAAGYEHQEAFWAHERNKLLYRMPVEELPDVLEFLKAQPADERFQFVVTGPGILEFLDPRVNKGEAMKRYAAKNGISVSEILTFGDEQNDFELIRDAGWGVAMCNGCEQCREAADAITEEPAANGGVGVWLYNHVIIPNGWAE